MIFNLVLSCMTDWGHKLKKVAHKFIKKYQIFFPLIVVLGLFSYFQASATDSPEISFDIFTQEDGLPNNQAQCIYQDNKGWIWVGTSQGLSRFDGYDFHNYLNNPSDSASLKGNLVRVIFEDRKGNLWVGTEYGGLNLFDRDKENFKHPYTNHPEFKFREVSVNAIEEGPDGKLWLGTDNNLLVVDTAGALKSMNPLIVGQDIRFAGNFVRKLKFDKKGQLWAGTNNGLFIYDPAENTIEPFPLPFSENQNKEIWELFLDDDGSVWIGTYSMGIFIVDPETRQVEKLNLEPYYERTETVRSISKGVFGDYWVGTRGGLYIYSKDDGVAKFYNHDERDVKSLNNNSVLDIFHDSRGETWIGTRGGVNLLAKSKQVFHKFSALPGDNHYLNSSIIYALWIGKDGKIYIGTEDGGVNIYNPETGTYEYLTSEESNPNSISQNCIKAFLNDGQGNLWIGTFWGGIDVLNLQTGEIANFHHDAENPGSLADNRVWDLCHDKYGRIWIATSKGVDRYDAGSGSFIHYPQLNGNEHVAWIETDSENNIWAGSVDEVIIFNQASEQIQRFKEHSRSFFEDSKNRYWISTFDRGIAVYSKTDGALKYYAEDDGLANNQALCILEDDEANLWISTNNGLSKFNPESGHFRNFTSSDGLQNNQFCYGAAYKAESGELLFGSISGFNIFNPGDIVPYDANVPVVLTDLKIFNKSIPITDGKKGVLNRSISETTELFLDYSQNVFTIEFAALSYVNSKNILYSYFLEGFNKDWNEPSTTRTATYTNLNPDEYLLRIKQVIPGNPVDGPELQIKVTILPPFWKTAWFRIAMLIAIIFMIYALMRFIINREKIKNELVLERANARKLHELDMLKLRFFTNISHEIRTPLTLILGPLEKLMSKRLPPDEIPGHLKLIHRNAIQLDRLISQLLDFRKLESGTLKLNLTQSDIVSFVSEIVNSFNELAKEKGVSLQFTTLKKSLVTVFDPDKIEKILNNLLSNAFKFTGAGGKISVNLSLVFDTNDEEFEHAQSEKQFVELTVKDTGQGIKSKNIDKIFVRFFQTGKGNDNSGAGIGLALVKELVKLHKGNIYVASKPGKGSRFTIRIPYEPYPSASEPQLQVDEDKIVAEELLDPYSGEGSGILHSKIMLIVEDNQDVRFFIKSHFNTVYNIIEARNGQEGWEKALHTIPDVIISDIRMPDVDGFEFCKRIKKDERTSHIPILLLTALHSKEHELKGLSYGADDYITKPFDIQVLQAKVENMLSIRESLKEKFAGTFILEPKNVVISSPDERFLQKAIHVVEENISNCGLDIEQFAVKVGVSRMQLYRKLHALTDMTVKEFIRHIRLKRATQLLIQKKMNVSEIAYAVGFKDLSHFRKCFRREFGMSATEYINQNQALDSN